MQGKIRIAQCGLGVQGKEMMGIVLRKQKLECVGAITLKTGVGKDLGDVLGISKKLGVIVSNDLDAVLSQTKPAVMLDATHLHVAEIYPHVIKALKAGVNVVSICEELANPWIKEPDLACSLDETAKENNVTIVATGINPGFNLDILPLTLTGVCATVNKIRVERVADLAASVASPTVVQAFGWGLSPEEVNKKLAEGKISMHVGLPETINVLADALGWTLTDVQEEKEALVSKVARNYPNLQIKPGQVFGCKYNGYGIRNGETIIEFKAIVCLNPTLDTDGIEPSYTLWIEGEPNITINMDGLSTNEGIRIGTAAHAVNWIPYVIKAKPGLLMTKDYPLVIFSS